MPLLPPLRLRPFVPVAVRGRRGRGADARAVRAAGAELRRDRAGPAGGQAVFPRHARDPRARRPRAGVFRPADRAAPAGRASRTPALRRQRGPRPPLRGAHRSARAASSKLNWMLAGEDPAKIDVLKQYLACKGLKSQECDVFVDCMLDYVIAGQPAPPQRQPHDRRRLARARPALRRPRGGAPRRRQRTADPPARLGGRFHAAAARGRLT